jgi:hypothetical protein
VPLLANMVEGGQTPVKGAAELGEIGFKIVIFPGALVRLTTRVMQDWFSDLKRDGTTASWQGRMHRLGSLNVLLSENYLNRVEYGVPPFRALTRVSQESASVHDRLDDYLDRVSRARGARPGVMLIPGVEVMPHYQWTGSPLMLDLLVSNTQKNLLVFGLTDRATLASIPVIGNGIGGQYSLQSLLDALPVVLLAPGVALLLVKRRRRQRIGAAVLLVPRRQWVGGLALCAVAVVAAVRGWPFTNGAYSAYGDHGVAPHQAVIDFVEQHGGVAVWSFPEARDVGTQTVGPVRVSWSTDPYPDDLLRTFRYTAFGALYEETTRLERPGGGWDRLLVQYAAGERSRPAWGLGESGFHDTNAGKRLARVQTVFLVRERSEAGVLEALRQGRLYARQRSAQTALALTEFLASSHDARAMSGETLRPALGAVMSLTIGIDAVGTAATDLKILLLKNGDIIEAWTGGTPFRATYRETWDGRPTVFRLEARGAGGRLLSSPIFVRRS